MNTLTNKLHNHKQRKVRIRSVVSGTPTRPRLTVTISNLHISAQLIDDTTGKTLGHATTVGQKTVGNMTERATKVGEALAAQAKTAKIHQVVFDRNGRRYHGRIKALADAARNAGLEF